MPLATFYFYYLFFAFVVYVLTKRFLNEKQTVRQFVYIFSMRQRQLTENAVNYTSQHRPTIC